MSSIKVVDFEKGIEINDVFYPKNNFRILVEHNGYIRIVEIETGDTIFRAMWNDFEAIDRNGDPVTITTIDDLKDNVLKAFFFRIVEAGVDGIGDVISTTTSVNGDIVLFSDATGKNVKSSNISIATTLGTDNTTLPTSLAVKNTTDELRVKTYTSTNIPALKVDQEIDYVIDVLNNTYRYKVLTATSALETPYTHASKFQRVSPTQGELQVKYSLFAGDGTGAETREAITYTVSNVTYLALVNRSSTAGGIIIYNLTVPSPTPVAVVALNGAAYITYSTAKNRFYVTTWANNKIYSYNYLGADLKEITYTVAAETVIETTNLILGTSTATDTEIFFGAKLSTNDNVVYRIVIDTTESLTAGSNKISANTYTNAATLSQASMYNNVFYFGFSSGTLNRIAFATWNSGAGTLTAGVTNVLSGVNIAGNQSTYALYADSDGVFVNWQNQFTKHTLGALGTKTEYSYGVTLANSMMYYIADLQRFVFLRRGYNSLPYQIFLSSKTNPYQHVITQTHCNMLVGLDVINKHIICYEATNKAIVLYKY